MQLIAIIDIGSHSTKLEIFKTKGHKKVKRLYKNNDYLYLFQDINSFSFISQEMMDKLVLLLLKYKKTIAFYECNVVKVIATSALRDASNSRSVISYLKLKTNLTVEVISGDQEAKFSQLAFLSLKIKSPFSTIFDLGGGSTEVSLFSDKEPIAFHSFNIGVIRCIKEKDDSEWNKLKTFIEKNKKEQSICIGLGSSIRRFAQLIKQKKHKKGYIINQDDVSAFNDILIKKGTDYIEKKYNLYGLKVEYLKTVVALLNFFYNSLNINKIYYYPISIRKGAALSLIKNNS